MRGRHLIVLLVAAALAVVAALWTSSVREPGMPGGGVGEMLIPALTDGVNEVTGVRLTGPGNETIATLQRGDDHWRLMEKNGYRANVADLRSLLVKLAEARLIEEKTSNPDYYDRLGVQPVDSADAGGVLVELEGIEAPKVIIGNQETSRDAVYVRRADEATSWLASGSVFVAKDTLQWMDRQLLDLPASRLAEVEIVHPDGATLLLEKTVFGQPNFAVAAMPEGRELQRDNIANPVGSVLQNLRIDDVTPEGESGFADLEITRASFRAFDGLVVNVDTATLDDKYYGRFSAATDAEVAARFQSQPAEAQSDGAQPEAAGPDEPQSAEDPGQTAAAPDLAAVDAEAQEFNERWSGWIFQLPKFKYDYLNRRTADLLKEESQP